MVDGNYRASGYPLSLDQISPTGTLKYIESLVYSPTYTDLVVTLEPENDKDPKPLVSSSSSLLVSFSIWTIDNIIYIYR